MAEGLMAGKRGLIMGVANNRSIGWGIARALAGHQSVEAALEAYSTERVQVGQAIVEHARHLGAYMQAQLKNEVDREMAERYRTPDAVMRETAVPARF